MAQSERDSRWVTFNQPYDHYWQSGAVTHYPPGEYRVKNAVADGAVDKGKASEGRSDGSEATPPGKRKRAKKSATAAPKSAKVVAEQEGPVAAETADHRSDNAMAEPGVAVPDRAAGGVGLDQDAG
jgi:hypothetical protein